MALTRGLLSGAYREFTRRGYHVGTTPRVGTALGTKPAKAVVF